MRGGYALCFLGGGEKMHAVLLEKERVAVKMRHAVLKGDLEAKLPGWEIIVGPREAVQLVKFLKDMQA